MSKMGSVVELMGWGTDDTEQTHRSLRVRGASGGRRSGGRKGSWAIEGHLHHQRFLRRPFMSEPLEFLR